MGSVFGAKAAGVVPQEKLRRVFGWFVVVMGVFMLAQEVPRIFGEPWPIEIPAALTLLATVVVVVLEKLHNHRAAAATGLGQGVSGVTP